ncbi:tetratricopeptide repeat protein [Orientia tsutsugamushi]
MNKGIALRELGQYQKAIENYDTAIRYRPDDAEAYVNK